MSGLAPVKPKGKEHTWPFVTIAPNKLIQLLFTIETKLRSEHSSPVTKTNLIWSAAARECMIWCMGSHPAAKSLSKEQVISHPFGKQWICEKQLHEMQLFKTYAFNRPFPESWSGSAWKEWYNLPTYNHPFQGSTELCLIHHSQIYLPIPKIMAAAFWWFCFGRRGCPCCGFVIFFLIGFHNLSVVFP